MGLIYEEAPPSAPPGYKTLTLAYAAVLSVVFIIPAALTRNVAAVLCAIITILAIYNKLKLKPWSVFLLAVASVILNTYAVGYAMSFKYAVIVSPLLSMT